MQVSIQRWRLETPVDKTGSKQRFIEIYISTEQVTEILLILLKLDSFKFKLKFNLSYLVENKQMKQNKTTKHGTCYIISNNSCKCHNHRQVMSFKGDTCILQDKCEVPDQISDKQCILMHKFASKCFCCCCYCCLFIFQGQ